MDLDDLIRTELTAQAERAPDARAVLAGIPARARSRRRRHLAAVAGAAAAAVLAAAVPYAVLRADPAPPAAPQPSISVPLSWAPTWKPAGLRETIRSVNGNRMEGRFATGPGPVISWSVGDGSDLRTVLEGPGLIPVAVGPYEGFWVTRANGDPGTADLAVRLAPGVWGYVTIAEPVPDPEGTAVRVGASFRLGAADVDLPLRFDRLPAGFVPRPRFASASADASGGGWVADWSLTGPGTASGAGRSTVSVRARRGTVETPPDASRTPVQIGSRTGTWVDYRAEARIDTTSERIHVRRLEVPLDDGVTLLLSPAWQTRSPGPVTPVPDATIERIAAGAVQLPVDYSWMR